MTATTGLTAEQAERALDLLRHADEDTLRSLTRISRLVNEQIYEAVETLATAGRDVIRREAARRAKRGRSGMSTDYVNGYCDALADMRAVAARTF